MPIVTIGYSGHRMGFIVDAFVGEQQIVIKPLGNHLKKVDNVAGVTILGAGDVVPILNVPDLMANAREPLRASASGRQPQRRARGPAQDPHLRGLVHHARARALDLRGGRLRRRDRDGRRAGLAKLREGVLVDAVVTDVQMPNMTGFELTRAIKSDSALAAIPVIIVTSLERDEEKAEGIEAGADAYITKSVFNQDTLLDTVERLIR